jgi:uncharacterized membrane protein
MVPNALNAATAATAKMVLRVNMIVSVPKFLSGAGAIALLFLTRQFTNGLQKHALSVTVCNDLSMVASTNAKRYREMILLIAGLVLFLGAHSSRIFAEDWRGRFIATRGENAWKGIYSVLSLVGLVLIVFGYADARSTGAHLWAPPVWTRHLAALLTLVAFIMLAAAYVPGTHIKAKLKHPMVLGIKVWAFAHLLSNARLAEFVLFGAFLLWAVLNFRAARQRDRASGTVYVAKSAMRDVIAVIVGLVAWGAFAFYLHARWIGVAPFAIGA